MRGIWSVLREGFVSEVETTSSTCRLDSWTRSEFTECPTSTVNVIFWQKLFKSFQLSFFKSWSNFMCIFKMNNYIYNCESYRLKMRWHKGKNFSLCSDPRAWYEARECLRTFTRCDNGSDLGLTFFTRVVISRLAIFALTTLTLLMWTDPSGF